MTVHEFNRLLLVLSLQDYQAVLKKAEEPETVVSDPLGCLASGVRTVMRLADRGQDVGAHELGGEQAAGIREAISVLGGEQRGET